MTAAKKRERQSNREKGFTLMELLVALVLFGLLSVAIFDALRFGGSVRRTAERRTNQISEFAATEDVLRRTIAQAFPAYASADPQDSTIRFQGTAQELDLVAPLPASIAEGVIAQQRIFAERGVDGLSLTIAWRLDLPPADPANPPAETTALLIRDLASMDFSYFGSSAPGTPPEWTDQWQNRRQLPQLVRIRLERRPQDGGRLPDMIVEPKLTVTSACRYDPVGPSCRRL